MKYEWLCWLSVGVYLAVSSTWPPIRYIVATVLVLTALGALVVK